MFFSLENVYLRCNLVTSEPASNDEAQDTQRWRRAMKDKEDMIQKNRTKQLVDRPRNCNLIGVRLIFKTRLNLMENLQT